MITCGVCTCTCTVHMYFFKKLAYGNLKYT